VANHTGGTLALGELWQAVRQQFAKRRPSEGLLSGKLKTCDFHSKSPKNPIFHVINPK
ncbi:hypothetical protein L195_g056827, partial [Trifolium pratense]